MNADILKRIALLLLVPVVTVLPGCGVDEGDVIAPTIAADAANVYFTRDRLHALSGTMEIGATVEADIDSNSRNYSDPVILDLTFDPLAGTWSLLFDELAPGGNTVWVKAIDPAGNQNILRMTVSFDFVSVDRLVTASSQTSMWLGGTVQSGLTPTVTVNNADCPVVLTPDPTRWECQLDLTALANGTYAVNAGADDGAGLAYDFPAPSFSVSTSLAYPLVTIDPPAVSPVADPVDYLLSGDRQTDAELTVTLNGVELDAGALDLSDPDRWSVTVTLREGKNFIVAAATVTDLISSISAAAYDAIWVETP